MRIPSIIALFVGLTLFAGCTHSPSEPPQPTYPASQVATPEPGHVEVAMAGSSGAALPAGALDMFISLSREQDFLSSPSVATNSPLAPCALLSAALASDQLNRMFAGISHPGSINFFPPRGTYILGLYDADMARGKGSIPRDDPNKATDILARLVIYHSWGFSMMLNTLITPMTQRNCLDLLTSPDKLDKALSSLRPSEAVLIHAPPVSAYVASYRREDGNLLLAELLQASFLDKASLAQVNPLSPCSLLGAFRLAARLNDAWNNKLTKGTFDAAGRPELELYVDDLRDGERLKAITPRTAEVTAAVFAAEILRANDLTSQLTQDATERDCLEEIFMPGTLRIRLMKDGIMLPLH